MELEMRWNGLIGRALSFILLRNRINHKMKCFLSLYLRQYFKVPIHLDLLKTRDMER